MHMGLLFNSVAGKRHFYLNENKSNDITKTKKSIR